MKSPFRIVLQVTALFVLFVGAVFVGRVLPVPGQAEAAPIQPAPEARPLMAPSWFDCGPVLEVAVIDYPEPGRVQVMCTNNLGGIQYFAFKGDDQATASRILSIFNSSMAMGEPLWLYYVTDDATSWGCPLASCRMLEGAKLAALIIT
jgi:hypothetical protein